MRTCGFQSNLDPWLQMWWGWVWCRPEDTKLCVLPQFWHDGWLLTADCFSLVYTFVFVFLNLVTRYKSWYCMKLSVERLIKVVGMCLTEESFTLILSVFVCTCEGTERKRLCMFNCTVKKKTLVWTIKGLAEHSGKKQRLMNMKNMSKVTPSLRSYTLYGYKVSSTSMIVLSTDRIV